MEQDELIYQVKKAIIDYYNIAKFEYSISSRSCLESMTMFTNNPWTNSMSF